MNDITKIIKLLENSGVLIDAVTETVKNGIKRTKRKISWRIVSTFSRFIRVTFDIFSSKSYKWKRSKKCRKRIYG